MTVQCSIARTRHYRNISPDIKYRPCGQVGRMIVGTAAFRPIYEIIAPSRPHLIIIITFNKSNIYVCHLDSFIVTFCEIMTTTNKFVFVFVFAQRVPISERCSGRVELSWNLGNGRIPCSGTTSPWNNTSADKDPTTFGYLLFFWWYLYFLSSISTEHLVILTYIFSICTYLSQIGIVTFFGRSAMCTLCSACPFPTAGGRHCPLSRSYGLPFLDIWTRTDALN